VPVLAIKWSKQVHKKTIFCIMREELISEGFMKRTLKTELIAWKEKKEHLPILLRGARQVGKSYLVEEFGRENFGNTVLVDFESRPEFKGAFETKEPKEIIAKLEISTQQRIIPGKTLLFLDEIQICPEALSALRYFKEKLPELHIIAAGSLLEFLLNDEKFSFPVGRVEFLYLHPLSFDEFLQAVAPLVAERIKLYSLKNPPSSFEHQELLKLVRQYMFVGGMPSAVQTFRNDNSFLNSQRVHSRILQAYESDFGKYAKQTQHKYLQMVFQKTPALIGQVLKYHKIDENQRARELKPATDLLCQAGLIQRVFATSAAGLPLHAHLKWDRFKLFYLDVGLLQTATKVDATHFFEQDIMQINAGMLAEQFVSQELIAYSPSYQNAPLLFWERSDGRRAEVDFIITVGSSIIPIEVKAGATGSLKSLRSYLEHKKGKLGIRISEHPLSINDDILSIPLYLIQSLDQIVLNYL
jgi:predicted AAA+ superfamily ATPase